MEEEEIVHKEARRSERDTTEEKVEEENGEDAGDREWKVAYQNVGGGIEATNILLARGRQESWDFVFTAEAWEGRKGERTTQQGYRAFDQKGSRLVLYIREEVDLQRLGKIETSQYWIQIGDTITGIYLSPSLNIGSIRDKLTELPTSDNIIGDANCTQSYKRRALLDTISARGLTEKPVKGNTWRRWHGPQNKWMASKPDIVFSTGNWITKGTEWTISDYAIIYSTIPSQIRKRKLLVTDWEPWMEFVEDEEKDTTYLDPIGTLNHAVKQDLRTRKYSPKPWWDSEIKEQRKVARRAGRNQGEWSVDPLSRALCSARHGSETR